MHILQLVGILIIVSVVAIGARLYKGAAALEMELAVEKSLLKQPEKETTGETDTDREI